MTKQTNNAKVNTQSKARTQSRETPTILLKTLHDDIMRANPTSTLTTKQMRVRLRATPATRDIHVRNASWIFTQSQYNLVRAMFDKKFAQSQERATKRDAKKRDASSNATPITHDDNVKADA